MKFLVVTIFTFISGSAFASGMIDLDADFSIPNASKLSAADLINQTNLIGHVAAVDMGRISDGKVISCLTRFSFDLADQDRIKTFVHLSCGVVAGVTQIDLANVVVGPLSNEVGIKIHSVLAKPLQSGGPK